MGHELPVVLGSPCGGDPAAERPPGVLSLCRQSTARRSVLSIPAEDFRSIARILAAGYPPDASAVGTPSAKFHATGRASQKGSRCAEDSLHGLRPLQICLPARLLAWQLPGSRYPPRTPGSRRLHCGALSRHAILWQLTCRPRYGGSARKRNGRGWICSTSVTIWFDIGSMLQPAAIRGNRKRKRSRFSETGRRRDSGLAQASARLYSAMSLPQACSAAGRS